MSQRNPNQFEIDTYVGEYILNGGDQAKAWRKAYPNSKAPEKVSWEKASLMHKMEKVQKRLVEKQSELRVKTDKELDLSVEKIHKTLVKVIELGLGGEPDNDGLMPSMNLSAVNSAIAEINKMNGNHAAQKIAANVTNITHEEWLNSLE